MFVHTIKPGDAKKLGNLSEANLVMSDRVTFSYEPMKMLTVEQADALAAETNNTEEDWRSEALASKKAAYLLTRKSENATMIADAIARLKKRRKVKGA